MMTAGDLMKFEHTVAELVKQRKIPGPVHLGGGNEPELISLFNRIGKEDWVVSTHRSHYHYLLKTGDERGLMERIMRGDSMHVFSRKNKFFSSAILATGCEIGCGIAATLRGSKVWVFIGDGASDNGKFIQSVRFAASKYLPITFVLENNFVSCDSTTNSRWNGYESFYPVKCLWWDRYVFKYDYIRTYPHVGVTEGAL